MGMYINKFLNLKDDYLCDRSRIQFRRANKIDNIEEMAELIYNSNPYIYPFWFNNDINEAKRCLSHMLLSEGKIYSIDNFYIAYDKIDDRIVGLICALDNTSMFSHNYNDLKDINYNYKYTIENYVETLEKEVENFNDKVMYISNICIIDELRGMRVGSHLLGCFLEQMQRVGYDTFHVDCLLHDLRTRNLYHSMGFKEMNEKVGFNGTNPSKVEIVSLLKKRGQYFPKDFQKSFMDKDDLEV